MIEIDIFSLDSNILIYGFDPDSGGKHAISRRLTAALRTSNARLPMQCLGEFYSVVVRKRFLAAPDAERLVNTFLQSVTVVAAEPADLAQAMQVQQQHRLQFFDSLILATLSRAGCTLLFSEDMQHRTVYSGVRVLNPFLLTPEELDALLA